MSYLLASPRLTAGPSGELISPADLAGYLGDIQVDPVARLLATISVSATQIVEEVLGYSFREREFEATIPEGNRNVPIWLPWGPAKDISVEPDGLTAVEIPSALPLVSFVKVDSSEEFTLSWTVGSQSDYPESAVMACLRVAAALWHNRSAEPGSAFKADILSIVGEYKARPDWT